MRTIIGTTAMARRIANDRRSNRRDEFWLMRAPRAHDSLVDRRSESTLPFYSASFLTALGESHYLCLRLTAGLKFQVNRRRENPTISENPV
jgi:hypothetical protein